MTTPIDTNVIVSLWKNEEWSGAARAALDAAYHTGPLVIAAPVFGELLATPKKSEAFIERFLEDTSIAVDWTLDETIWRRAGRGFRAYAERRRRQGDAGPRRILADFLIGAHADLNRYSLLTLDDRIFRANFPKLQVLGVS